MKRQGREESEAGEGVSRAGFEKPCTMAAGETHGASPATRSSPAVGFPLLCLLLWSVCDVTVRSLMVSVEVKGELNQIKKEHCQPFLGGASNSDSTIIPLTLTYLHTHVGLKSRVPLEISRSSQRKGELTPRRRPCRRSLWKSASPAVLLWSATSLSLFPFWS